MDLSSLNVAQLRELLERIPSEIKKRELLEKGVLLNEVREFVRSRGYTIEELLARDAKVKAGGENKVKVKYRHPQHPELEWTGRGRKPKWVEAWLAEGASLEGLLA